MEWFIEGQAFLRSYDLAPRPPPSPFSKRDRRHTGRLRKKDNLLTGDGVRGWAKNQNIEPQGSLALYKSFNALGVEERGPSDLNTFILSLLK
jgi:hypothetical protein